MSPSVPASRPGPDGSPLVRRVVADGVSTITLDSPHNRNALSRALVEQLVAALTDAAEDDGRVVVLRSADRVFCSGADLKEAGAGAMEQGARALVELQRLIVEHPKPVVCRLAGPVRAGGLGLVAASDAVLCAEEVIFAFTESRLGLAPAAISLTVLPRLSARAAADTFLTGRTFDAAEAVAMGLVTRAVPAAALDDAVAEVCDQLAQAHPQGLAETKRLLTRDLRARIADHGPAMADLSARLFASDAAREAMAAALRRPR